jgi:hypothetical protein
MIGPMVVESRDLPLRIVVTHPPSDPHSAFGVQDRAGGLAPPVARSSESAIFEITLRAGGSDDPLRGPFVHGRPGSRFLYLSFADRGGTGWARRIKIPLDSVTGHMIAQADDGGLETEVDGRQSASVKTTWRPAPAR